jgi:hypothetical protein
MKKPTMLNSRQENNIKMTMDLSMSTLRKSKRKNCITEEVDIEEEDIIEEDIMLEAEV